MSMVIQVSTNPPTTTTAATYTCSIKTCVARAAAVLDELEGAAEVRDGEGALVLDDMVLDELVDVSTSSGASNS